MRSLLRPAACLAALTAICGIGAAPARAAVPAVLTLESRVSVVHVGETLRLRGTLTPAAPGEPVVVLAALDGRPLPGLTARIDAVGTYRTSLRVTRAGRLSLRAGHAASAVAGAALSGLLELPVAGVGRARAGCQGPATITREVLSRPPLSGADSLGRGALLEPGAHLLVPNGAAIRLRRGSTTYRSRGGRLDVECRALKLLSGSLGVRGGKRSAHVLLGVVLASVARRGRLAVSARPRRIHVVRGHGVVTSSASPRAIMHTVAGDTVLVDDRGLPRMDTWPFAKSPDQWRVPRRAVPPYWADGSACATGCRPAGALAGWPLEPFHRAHPLRAGLNEWRPDNMHIGVDIQALDGTRVYAIQSGRASIAGAGTVEIRVRVGSYEYWHVVPHVHAGQYVRAHRTVVGRIIRGAGHLHVSELRDGYLNPLRPGGRVLAPYRDTEEPVIGAPRRHGGEVFVEAFDPQSLRETLKYRTPVLAPAAIAWRARDARGRALTPLHFAYRGAHHYPDGAKSLVYGPGTTPPTHAGALAGGWACFWRFTICVPKWNYRLAGVPSGAASLTVYVWDWAGNVARRTSPLQGIRALEQASPRARPEQSPGISAID